MGLDARRQRVESARAVNRGGGRPPLVSNKLKKLLERAFRDSPARAGYAREGWSGALVARLLADRYSITVTERHARRLLRQLGPARRVMPGARSPAVSLHSPSALPYQANRRARPGWDGLNKELALRRIKRLASSGLPLEPFVQTLFKLINDAVPNAPNRPFLVGNGDRTDAYMGDTQEVYDIVPAQQHFYVGCSGDLSGLAFRHTPDTYKYLFPQKPIWRLEEWMLPHFYRSEGYNQIFRKLGYHHMIFVTFAEHGVPAGFYPIWRGPDQPPFNRDDFAFLQTCIPHVTHGLKVAQKLGACLPPGDAFSPLAAWGNGIVLIDQSGRLIAADEIACATFARVAQLDYTAGLALKGGSVGQALDYIAQILKSIFYAEGSHALVSPAPVVRVYPHWSGIVIRLRGIWTPGTAGGGYFIVIVESGELESQRRGRLRSRWGLSEREFDILTAASTDEPRAASAARLQVTPQTLKTYFQRLADKLDLGGMRELQKFARDCLVS